MPKGKMQKNDGHCTMCGCDISHKKSTALYCDDCKRIADREKKREWARWRREYYLPKKCNNCGTVVERTEELKYWTGYCEKCK